MQVPIEADMELGRRAMEDFPYSTINHHRWTPLIESVGRDLVSSSWSGSDRNMGRYQWDFGVVDGSTVNAFALPGKIVRVTLCVLLARKVAKFLLIKGSMYCSFWFCVSRCYGNSPLLKQLKPSEGELAALLAHEIGHVICRHSQARIIQRQVVAMVLKALSYEDDDAHNENFGEAVCDCIRWCEIPVGRYCGGDEHFTTLATRVPIRAS